MCGIYGMVGAGRDTDLHQPRRRRDLAARRAAAQARLNLYGAWSVTIVPVHEQMIEHAMQLGPVPTAARGYLLEHAPAPGGSHRLGLQ